MEATGACPGAGAAWATFCRLASHSSRNDPCWVGAAGREDGAGAGPLGPKPVPAGRGAGAWTDILLVISLSTTLRGLPYFAAASCFRASPRRGFGVPSDGRVTMLNGCVGTPPTSVRTIVL